MVPSVPRRNGQTPVKPPKKYMLNATGMVEGGPDDWNSYSYNVYTDIDGLKAQPRKVFKKGTVIPGQPPPIKGKPLNYLTYNWRRYLWTIWNMSRRCRSR